MRLVFGRKESEGKCGKVVVVRLRSGIEREKERNRRERKCGIECSFEKEERDLKKIKKINTNIKEGFGFEEGDEIVFVCMVEN